ncbi:acyltransferase [Acinetobacter radioresistens]|uniref:acyltransferase family protein n=1 Tax=Acinetobacter radioresistens TaxID=40216 RepID=UPI002006016B|nr:acyltransferase [Acinetobacter radioresistens]MCK4098434.1 acyltransferase [Acinetobacter radioresistens]
MRLALLDYARFFAALSVVFFHYFYNGLTNGKVGNIERTWFADIAAYGHYGVQFFFIISGYVIFLSVKNKSASSFLKSRLKRLYPTYWVAVLFTGFFAMLWANGTDMAVTIPQILVNLTMLQKFLGVANVDGVYWTLVFELLFYAFVFLILLFGNFKKLVAFLLAWPFFIAVFATFSGGFMVFNLYFAYFVVGAMFALLKTNSAPRHLILLSLAVAVCAGFYQMYLASLSKQHNLIIVALIYAAMLGFFAIQNMDRFRKINLPRSQDIGGMTYPIYLIHAHFGYMILNRFATPENQALVYTLLLLTVISLSWILWYVIEVKQANFWHKFFSFSVKPVEKIEAKLN